METRRFFLGLTVVILLSLSGCESNDLNDNAVNDYRTQDVLYKKNAKLKRIYQVFSDNHSELFSEYEYDKSGRISKTFLGDSYSKYEYNAKGQLATISNFYKNELSPNKTVSYTYDGDGNIIKELTDPVYVNPNMSGYVLYKYENKRLIRSEHYVQDKISFRKLYEYNDAGEKVKEYMQIPDEEGDPVITENTYKEKLLVYSITFEGEKSNFIHDSKKVYDMNDNLILTIDNVPGLSSASYDPKNAFYLTRRYEYQK
jgi:hypothetical protein